MSMKELVRARRERALAMGGTEAIAKQDAEGKLSAREQIGRLFDPSSSHEIGLLATHANISPAMQGKETPADGAVPGFGKIGGRPASLIAYDFTPEGGTNIIFSREIAAAANPDEERARKVEEFRRLINAYLAAEGAFIDDVIDPQDTRPAPIRALEMAASKKVDRPWKEHGVMPV
jgi:acetyl-CoA carboxylase carboxyltransferase component